MLYVKSQEVGEIIVFKCIIVFLLYFFFKEFFQEFDSKYFGNLVIEYKEKEDQDVLEIDLIVVLLLCKVQFFYGVEIWDNVIYKIEWFFEGKCL